MFLRFIFLSTIIFYLNVTIVYAEISDHPDFRDRGFSRGYFMRDSATSVLKGTSGLPVGLHSYKITGELIRGEKFAKEFGNNLILELSPTDTGWLIEIKEKTHPDDDFLWVATPPFRFDNPRYLEMVYGRDIQQTVEWTPRDFFFVTSYLDYQKLKEAIPKVLWPTGESPETIQAAEQLILGSEIPKGTGHLQIIDAQITPPNPQNPQGVIEKLQFEVILFFPISSKNGG
jgi:hypothetical protein